MGAGAWLRPHRSHDRPSMGALLLVDTERSEQTECGIPAQMQANATDVLGRKAE
jgi:hypothetical protein